MIELFICQLNLIKSPFVRIMKICLFLRNLSSSFHFKILIDHHEMQSLYFSKMTFNLFSKNCFFFHKWKDNGTKIHRAKFQVN